MKIEYTLIKKDKNCNARLGKIKTNYGEYETPMFMPVGTQATVKTLSPEEVTSLLNELADEMIRYNFKNTEKASATIQSEISDTETYYYLSEQPNYLIYKTRLIG